MLVAIYRSASSRPRPGRTPSPSSRTVSAGPPRNRRRDTTTRRACASIEFCTSSATALRGSDCDRASQRMRSNGSAGRSTNVRADAFGTGSSVARHYQRRLERQRLRAVACLRPHAMSDRRATVPPMQSEQTRQWRRERKRLKREERRQAFRPPADVTISLRALPPMGDTLLEYAHPLISVLLPADHGPEELRAALRLASVFWNSVLDEEEVDEAIPIPVRKLVEKLQMTHTQANRLTEALLARRVQLFGHDPRIAQNIEVSRDGDRLRVTARSTV